MHRGEEVTICYVDPAMRLSQRRRALRECYQFECACARCREEGAGRAGGIM